MDQTVKEKVVSKLNHELGRDVKNLSKCNELNKNLEHEKTRLEKMLSLASSEVPSKVSVAISAVEETCRSVETLSDEYETIKKANCFNQLLNKAAEEDLNPIHGMIDEIGQLQRKHAYLECAASVHDLSEQLETALLERDDGKCVSSFGCLCAMFCRLRATRCVHLANFIKDTTHYWHNLLKERFTSEFAETLKIIRWPLVSSNTLVALPVPEALARFQLLLEYLLKIQLPEALTTRPSVTSSLLADFPPPSLPLSLMLRPLRQRFLFHFCGSKQTNRPDKPEWYFMQILTWAQDHQQFLAQWVQPVYNRLGLKKVSAKTELERGLVELAADKLHADMAQLMSNDAHFSHAVDETLAFDSALRCTIGYPVTEPSALGVLTQAPVFVKWISMERKYAGEKMDAMLSSEGAWHAVTSSDGSRRADDMKATEVGEAFLTLLATMRDRYSTLPQPGHRLQLLELQLELVDDFRVRLLQLLHEERRDPLVSRLPAILNTVAYITAALADWGTDPYLLMLHHYKIQQDNAGNATPLNATGTVFDRSLELWEHLRDELIGALCEAVMLEVKARSRPYRRDRWFSMPPLSGLVAPSVTPSACPMFEVLSAKLQLLQTMLASALFSKAWKDIASQLSMFIFEEVIMENTFNEGGAKQLEFDMLRNMLPLFRQFTPRPELYFALVKEACALLTALPRRGEGGDGMGLRGRSGLRAEAYGMKLNQLTQEQAAAVLSRRSDVSIELM